MDTNKQTNKQTNKEELKESFSQGLYGRLKIYQKMYDLILYAFPIINKFPKSQRFVLGQQIENTMVDILKLLIQANKEKNKNFTFFKIDVEIEKLRSLIRLTKDLRFMSIEKYGNLAEKISEVGRLLGGWIKSTRET